MTDDPDRRRLIDPAAIDKRSGKPKQLSKRVKTAIRAILAGDVKTQKEACALTGLNESHFSEQLLSPAGRVFIERERRKTIVGGSLRAARRLNSLVDAASEHVSFDASRHILAIEGIKPSPDAAVSVSIDIKAGYVIDLSNRGAMRDVTPIAATTGGPPEIVRSVGPSPDDQQSGGQTL